MYAARKPAACAMNPPASAPSGISPQPSIRYTLLTRPSSSAGTIRCRMVTVTTFHIVTKNPLHAISAAATAKSGASPIPTSRAANAAIATISDVSSPSRRVIAGFTRPPSTLPMAAAVHSSP